MQDSRTLAISPAGGGLADDLVKAIVVPATLWSSTDPGAYTGGHAPDTVEHDVGLRRITSRAPDQRASSRRPASEARCTAYSA